MFYSIIKPVFYILLHIFFRIKVLNKKNVPGSGSLIICCNHISLLDPAIVAVHVKRKITFLAKAVVFKWFLLGFIAKKCGAIPVNPGKSDITALKACIKTLKEGKIFGIFPEGARYFIAGELKTQTGIAMIAHKTKAPVLPVRIVCNGRARLFKKITVVFGRPKSFEELGFGEGRQEDFRRVSESIYREILSLG